LTVKSLTVKLYSVLTNFLIYRSALWNWEEKLFLT